MAWNGLAGLLRLFGHMATAATTIQNERKYAVLTLLQFYATSTIPHLQYSKCVPLNFIVRAHISYTHKHCGRQATHGNSRGKVEFHLCHCCCSRCFPYNVANVCVHLFLSIGISLFTIILCCAMHFTVSFHSLQSTTNRVCVCMPLISLSHLEGLLKCFVARLHTIRECSKRNPQIKCVLCVQNSSHKN